MAGLHCLGGGLDAVIVGTKVLTEQQRLARYEAARDRAQCKWLGYRIEFGTTLQRAMRAGIRVDFKHWQRALPQLWPRIKR
jgi:hypothetical protein